MEKSCYSLVVEVEKDATSESGFHLGNDEGCVCGRIGGAVAFDSPTRVLVPRPTTVLEESGDETIDCTGGMAVGSDEVGAKVVRVAGRSWALICFYFVVKIDVCHS